MGGGCAYCNYTVQYQTILHPLESADGPVNVKQEPEADISIFALRSQRK